jgi:hypothetical protein
MHEIARLVDEEVGDSEMSEIIREVANGLHMLSIADDKANSITNNLIKHIKNNE